MPGRARESRGVLVATRFRKIPLPRPKAAAAPSAFGSDVYERYTALYTWESNQVAHAGMGFFGAAVLVIDTAMLFGPGPWALLGLPFFIVPFMKDVTDYAIDTWRQHPAFPSDRRELILDWIADDLHWAAGIILAVGFALIPAGANIWLVGIYWPLALIVIAAGVIWSRRHFVPEKQSIDDAGLLYYARLARFTGSVSDADANAVLDFIEGHASAPAHLLVSGVRGTGKTELALAVAAELAVSRVRVRYISLDALIDALNGDDWPDGKAAAEPWPPMQADVVVIDDLEDHPEAIAAIQVLLSRILSSARAKTAFRCRRFVWVAGDAAVTRLWRTWIAATFPAQEIASIWLGLLPEGELPPFRWLENITLALPIFLGAASVSLWLFAPLGWWIAAAYLPGIVAILVAGLRRSALILLGAGFAALGAVRIAAFFA